MPIARAKYTLWAVGNFTLASVILVIMWAGASLVPSLWLAGMWPLVLIFVAGLSVCTVLWPAWIVGQGLISVALVRLANRKQGRLAYLSYDRYGPTIELATTDPSVVRWHRLGLAALLPGWRGYAAAVLLTVCGGVVLSWLWMVEVPLWASTACALGWATGWVWYVREVRQRVRRRR